MKIVKQFFLRALRLLKEVRNNYAHSNRNGESNSDNYKGISYKVLNVLFSPTVFSSTISKNQYNNFIKKSPESVAFICLFRLLDKECKRKFLLELISLFEERSIKEYNLEKDFLIDKLNLSQFYTFLEHSYYNVLEDEEDISNF